MNGLIDAYKMITLPYSDEVERLANIYVAGGIIPLKYRDDARHIATAAVNGLDCILSCNMGHITKQKTMIETGFTNLREGYKWIGISTPMEVVSYDERRTGSRA
ncbi:hypothetical protein FACS1894200_09430 [Spirochaetia bacterium]|nr:hypothetical protein FACS1894200_09430 [Spirochaetia bacterium]